MPDNYSETDISGKSWKRVYQITINNPLDNRAHLVMREQEVINIGDRKIYQDCGTLYREFSTESELDMAIYEKLNELYVLLRKARDDA